MTTEIPSACQPFVRDAVASGKYRSEGDLILAALQLLEKHERRLDALRDDIQAGLDQLNRGEGIVLRDQDAQQAFFDDIKAHAQAPNFSPS